MKVAMFTMLQKDTFDNLFLLNFYNIELESSGSCFL